MPNNQIKNETEMVVDKISDRIASCIPDWYGSQASLFATPPVIEKKRYSFLLHYFVKRFDQEDVSILVKIDSRPEIKNIEEAIQKPELLELHKAEYTTMRSIEEIVRGKNVEGIKSIRMLGYFPEINAIIMEKFEGKTLRSLVLNKKTLLRQKNNNVLIRKTGSNAGRWLRMFHENVGEKKLKPFEPTLWLKLVHDYLSQITYYSENKKAKFLYEEFEIAAHKLSDQPVLYSILHGDFQMNNILYMKDGSVACIDPNAPKNGMIYMDIARFILDPHTLKLQVLSQGLAIRSDIVELFRQSFLKGYYDNESYNQKFLHLCSAFVFLKKWHNNERIIPHLKFTAIKHSRDVLSLYIRRYYLYKISNELSEVISS